MNEETDDITNSTQESSSARNKRKEKIIANIFHYKSIEDQITMIIKNDKEGKEIVASGQICDEDIVTDTKKHYS